MKKIFVQLLPLLALIPVLFSCKKTNNLPAPALVKEWTLQLKTKNENPAPSGRSETGTFILQVYNDNSVKYQISVNNLTSGDALTLSHIHTGNPAANGPVILDFSPSFSGNAASGTITNIRSSFIDSLTGGTADLYVNVHSTQAPAGLLRAQINSNVEWAEDFSLTGANEVPAVTTTATGAVRFRLTTQGVLYYFINVTGLTASDGTLTAAHIHSGAAGANGSVLIALASSAANFGVVQQITLSSTQLDAIKGTAAVYVNAHSTLFPAGLVRAQIR